MAGWDLTRILFWLVATGVLGSSLMVVLTKKPVIGVLALIACFVQAAILWLLLGAEFLSMGLIFVYVGAVMTLFLFVVMMLNQNQVDEMKNRMKILLLGFFIFAFIAYCLSRTILPNIVDLSTLSNVEPNVNAIGQIMYTKYMLSFEISAMILLVAMLSAITLVFRGRKQKNKHQNISEQVAVKAEDRITMHDLRNKA